MMDRLTKVELAAAQIGTVSQPLTQPVQGGGHLIQNIADPVKDADAVTKRYLFQALFNATRNLQPATPAPPPPSAGGGGTIPGIPPEPPGTPPPPGPSGPPATGSLSGATDAFALAGATIYDSPLDIATWPITTTITQLNWVGNLADFTKGGLQATFGKENRPGGWPDYTPPGWTGPLQYTLWIFFLLGGVWYGSGIIQYWYAVPPLFAGGSPLNVAPNWVYNSRWGAMQGHQPAAGETVGFMVSAGNARGVGSVTSVKERSQVTTIAFPPPSGGVFT